MRGQTRTGLFPGNLGISNKKKPRNQTAFRGFSEGNISRLLSKSPKLLQNSVKATLIEICGAGNRLAIWLPEPYSSVRIIGILGRIVNTRACNLHIYYFFAQ